VTCFFWNELGQVVVNNSVEVVPELVDFLNVDLSYYPYAVPINVTYSFSMTNGSEYSHLIMTCNFDFEGNRSMQIDLTVHRRKVERVTLEYVIDEPFTWTNMTCWNQFFNFNQTFYVIKQENITGFSVELNNSLYRTTEDAFANFTLETGSHVTYEIFVGDGRNWTVQDDERLAAENSDSFTWNYPNHGVFDVTVTAFNFHTAQTVNVRNVTVQHIIQHVLLASPDSVQVPDGKFNINVTHSLTPFPTNVTCNVAFVDTRISLTWINTTDQICALQCTRSMIGSPLPVTVSCENMVSQVSTGWNVSCEELVIGLDLNSKLLEHRQTSVFVTTSLVNGSHVRYSFDFGDGSEVEFFDNPQLFAVDHNLEANHTFETVGNYTVSVTACNSLNCLNHSIGPIIILDPVTCPSVVYNTSVLYTPATVQFWLSHACFPVTNVHCEFDFGEFGSMYRYIEYLSDTTRFYAEESFDREAIGLRNFTVNCSNLLDWQELETPVDIILDAVIIGEFYNNGSVLNYNATTFILNITRFGTNGCFVFDFGDNTGWCFGIPTLCEPYAKANDLNFTEIGYEDTKIVFTHLYPWYGTYSASVYAFNHVSNDTAENIAVVLDWLCFEPALNFTHNDSLVTPMDPEIRLQHRRSETLVIDAVADLNCTKTQVNVRTWLVADYPSQNVVLKNFPDSLTLTINKRTLWYGNFSVMLNLAMFQVDPPVSGDLNFYLEIVKTPLEIRKIDGPEEVEYNQDFSLNAKPFIRDYDVEDGNLTGITFNWVCLQLEENSTLEFNISTVIDRPNTQGVTNYAGCYGNGAGIIRSGNSEVAGTFKDSSYHFMPNKTYLFRLIIYKDTRWQFFEKTLFVQPQKKPQIEMQ
jgi:PKD repeat protein